MKIQDAEKMARDLMDHHGLKRWKLLFSTKMRSTFGKVKYGKGRSKMTGRAFVGIIKINSRMVLLNKEKQVRNTVIHEIAHALAPVGSHHNLRWQQIAKSLGDDGERCYGDDVVQITKK